MFLAWASLLLLCSSAQAAVSGDSTISADIGGKPLVITTTERLSGAIGSLTWNGKEFIDSADHGRELQSASSFDGHGECFNPTEAGSRDDGAGTGHTSVLTALRASGDRLLTQTQMAFWLLPGETGACPAGGTARNEGPLSGHVLTKSVTIGYRNMPHVIEYLVDFHVPEPHASAQFEALTGYMPPEFSSFWAFDPATGGAAPISGFTGEQGLPVIFSAGASHAMGIYSPGASYGVFGSEWLGAPVVKWNAVFRRAATPAGDYSMRCFVIVGSLADVKASTLKLHRYLHPSAAGSSASATNAGAAPLSGQTGAAGTAGSSSGSASAAAAQGTAAGQTGVAAAVPAGAQGAGAASGTSSGSTQSGQTTGASPGTTGAAVPAGAQTGQTAPAGWTQTGGTSQTSPFLSLGAPEPGEGAPADGEAEVPGTGDCALVEENCGGVYRDFDRKIELIELKMSLCTKWESSDKSMVQVLDQNCFNTWMAELNRLRGERDDLSRDCQARRENCVTGP
ncbi:MAG TPA: hypothetical protein DCM05_10335 [Elusimicrobia bacterium]|nr:hypothetical protein [Elusimicrobiota bacterium]